MSAYRAALRKLCRKRGWSLAHLSGGHYRLTRQGCPHLVCSATPHLGEEVLKRVRREMERAEQGQPPRTKSHKREAHTHV